MELFKRIIFVGKSGATREPMAVGILKECTANKKIEILARGLVVSFPEPMNQKAEAVLITGQPHKKCLYLSSFLSYTKKKVVIL